MYLYLFFQVLCYLYTHVLHVPGTYLFIPGGTRHVVCVLHVHVVLVPTSPCLVLCTAKHIMCIYTFIYTGIHVMYV